MTVAPSATIRCGVMARMAEEADGITVNEVEIIMIYLKLYSTRRQAQYTLQETKAADNDAV